MSSGRDGNSRGRSFNMWRSRGRSFNRNSSVASGRSERRSCRSCSGSSGGRSSSSKCSRNCFGFSCRSSKPRGMCNDDGHAARKSAQGSTRSCFESLYVIPILPQVIWETVWRRTAATMFCRQLLVPRLPNRSEVSLTEARGIAACLEHTDGAELLFGANSVLKPASAASAPGLIRVAEARQATARAIAHCPGLFERGAMGLDAGETENLIN